MAKATLHSMREKRSASKVRMQKLAKWQGKFDQTRHQTWQEAASSEPVSDNPLSPLACNQNQS